MGKNLWFQILYVKVVSVQAKQGCLRPTVYELVGSCTSDHLSGGPALGLFRKGQLPPIITNIYTQVNMYADKNKVEDINSIFVGNSIQYVPCNLVTNKTFIVVI